VQGKGEKVVTVKKSSGGEGPVGVAIPELKKGKGKGKASCPATTSTEPAVERGGGREEEGGLTTAPLPNDFVIRRREKGSRKEVRTPW